MRAIVPRYLEVAGAAGSVVAQVQAEGAPAPDGTQVSFTGSLGLSFSPVVAPTHDGLAEATVFPGRESGFAQVDAAVGLTRGSATLWVKPGEPDHAILSASPSGTAPGGTVSVSARVFDLYGNPADGASVRWAADGGSITPEEGFVERGLTAATLTAGDGPLVTARLTTGSATAQVSVPVAGETRPDRVFVPFAATHANVCRNIVRNPDFGEDRNADGAPDGWALSLGSGSAQLTSAGPGRPGRSLRLVAPVVGDSPEAQQQWEVGEALSGAVVRVWLRGDPEASLRLDLWSMGDVGGRVTRLPLLVETLPAAADWQLHVFALPVPPTGHTELRLSPRGTGAGSEVTGIVLEICP